MMDGSRTRPAGAALLLAALLVRPAAVRGHEWACAHDALREDVTILPQQYAPRNASV